MELINLIGAVSWGVPRCIGDENSPTVYTNIINYEDWIYNNICQADLSIDGEITADVHLQASNSILHVTSRKTDNTGWDWSKQTIFSSNGKVSFKNSITVNGEVNSTSVNSSGILKGTDIVSGGSNSWVFHTPDDGRKNLYLAPRKSDDSGWDWSKYTIFYGTGKVAFKNNISVNGKIESKEVKVSNTPTADFVFEEDYNLPSLASIEKHIKLKYPN